MTPAGERLFFVADTERYGREVWTSDGTDAGTHLVFDRFTERSTDDDRFIPVSGMAAVGESVYVLGYRWLPPKTAMDVYFGAFHTVAELWKIHGEPLSAELVKALPHGETTGHGGQLSDLGGQFYFYFDGWLDDGSEQAYGFLACGHPMGQKKARNWSKNSPASTT